MIRKRKEEGKCDRFESGKEQCQLPRFDVFLRDVQRDRKKKAPSLQTDTSLSKQHHHN
jgi:hypothetical protein